MKNELLRFLWSRGYQDVELNEIIEIEAGHYVVDYQPFVCFYDFDKAVWKIEGENGFFKMNLREFSAR